MEALNALAPNLDPEIQAIIEAALQDHAAQALAAAAVAEQAAVAIEVDERNGIDHNALRRFRKLHPPTFSHREKQDPIDWMYEVEMLMDLAELPNAATKIAAIPLVLVDRALIWWKSEEVKGTIPDHFDGVGGYKAYFLAYHSSPDPARKIRDQLDELRQTGSVSHYTARFRTLISRAQMTDEEIKHKYVKHLKAEVQNQVSLGIAAGGLDSFEKIVAYAEATDTVLFENRRRFTRPPPSEAHSNSRTNQDSRTNQRYQLVQRYNQPRHIANRPDPNGVAPMDLSALPNGQQLSPELKIKLIRAGKCFYCRTGNHLAINCPLKKQHNSPNGRRQ